MTTGNDQYPNVFFSVSGQRSGWNSWGFKMVVGASTVISDSSNATQAIAIPYAQVKQAVSGVLDEEAVINLVNLIRKFVPAIPEDVLHRARPPLRNWVLTSRFDD